MGVSRIACCGIWLPDWREKNGSGGVFHSLRSAQPGKITSTAQAHREAWAATRHPPPLTSHKWLELRRRILTVADSCPDRQGPSRRSGRPSLGKDKPSGEGVSATGCFDVSDDSPGADRLGVLNAPSFLAKP